MTAGAKISKRSVPFVVRRLNVKLSGVPHIHGLDLICIVKKQNYLDKLALIGQNRSN